MPRRRRTPGPSRSLGPQQNPRNMGLNRAASMRGNNRNLGQNQPFQGGLGQGPAVAPGQPAGPPQPGAPRPGAQQGAGQCPVGQKFGPTPDGRMGCIPDRRAGAPGAPGAPGTSPAGGTGAGTPSRGTPNRYNEGR